jgi:hypothetical protein
MFLVELRFLRNLTTASVFRQSKGYHMFNCGAEGSP